LSFIITLLFSTVIFANDPVDTEVIEPSSILQVADSESVVINGKVRFSVIGISSYPAKRRASEVAERVEALAKNKEYDPETLLVEEAEAFHLILPVEGGEPILRVLEADAQFEGVSRTVLAGTIRNSILESIIDYRHEHQPGVLLKNALYTLGSVIVMIALLFLVFWLFRHLDRFLQPRVTSHIKQLEARSQRIFQGSQIWGLLHGALQLVRTVIVLFVIYVFSNFALSLFPETRYVAHKQFQFVFAPLSDMFEAIISFIPDLMFLVILFFITRYMMKLARGVFAAIDKGRLKFKEFEPEWAWPTYRLVRLFIIILALVVAYPFIPGSDSAAFQGISVLLGVLFSLGSTSVISNVIAGYTMTYRRAFKIGDRVKIGNNVGHVTEMRVLVTHLRTPKNEEVVIPNSSILNGEVTNYSTMARTEGLILHTVVGIGYEVPWRQVEAMLLLAAENTDGLLKEPKPFIRQKLLADFAVNYELNVYCDNASKMMGLYTEMHRNIQDVFNENEIQIMTPAYRGDPIEPKFVPKEQWYTPPVNKP
jgi:small-conductance mechanosensitive channel